MHHRYTLGKVVGQGGFGEVVLATCKASGEQYACKCIRKRLDCASTSFVHQAAHVENIKREVAILRRLKGTLNVAPIVAAYEDDAQVYVLLEYCQGGELWQHIGKLQGYSERTVQPPCAAMLLHACLLWPGADGRIASIHAPCAGQQA